MMRVIGTLVVVAVVALSLRRLVLLLTALLRRRALPSPVVLPTVALLVPARNEEKVAGRLLGALARLEYPDGKLSLVLICDGCSDGTPAAFRAWAAGRSSAHVLELPRLGKAAALNAGLRLAETEIVAVVDADLEPRPDFLLELVRPFADGRVAGAAAYLRPANADQNLVTRYAAITTWVHQLITSAGTDRLGLSPPTFGAAAYRRAALEEITGFPVVPAGVDVAVSTELIRQGWRTRFVATAVADNTVVSDLRNYWRQHLRWGRGTYTARSTSRPRFRSSWAQRLEAGASATGYGDRLVFGVAIVGTVAGALPVWVPLLYLAVPGLDIVAALLKAGVRRRLSRFLLASVLFFPVDLAASAVAVFTQVAGRPHRWHSPR